MNFRIANGCDNTNCLLCKKRMHGKGVAEIHATYNDYYCLKCGMKLIRAEIKEHIKLMRIIIDARKQEIFDEKFKDIKNEMLDACLRELREEE